MRKLLLPLVIVLTLSIIHSTQAQAQIGQGIVACWDMEESTGERVDTVSGLNLTDNNTVGNTSGLVGNAAAFVAANNEYLSHIDDESLSFTSATIYTAVSPQSSGSFMALVNKGTLSTLTLHEYALAINSSNLPILYVGDGVSALSSVTHSSPVSVGSWNHVIGWFDAATLGIVLDNVEVTTPAAGSSHNAAGSFYIGALAVFNTWYMNGYIDTVAIWNRKLTSAEMTWVYNSGNGRSCSEMAPTPPTPTPTPGGSGATIIDYTLPNDVGIGQLEMKITVGEAAVIIGLLALITVAIFQVLQDIARGARAR